MATVSGLTAEKALSLLQGVSAVEQKQSEADAEIAQLRAEVEAAREVLAEFAGLTVPQLEATLAANATAVSELTDTTLVDLDATLSAHQEALDNMNVEVGANSVDIESQYVNIQALPHTFTQPTAPIDGEDEWRPLMIGDRWNDTSTPENQEHRWDGTEWVVANFEIEDLSITVQKFKTSTHMIY